MILTGSVLHSKGVLLLADIIMLLVKNKASIISIPKRSKDDKGTLSLQNSFLKNDWTLYRLSDVPRPPLVLYLIFKTQI